ncbi:MULTISPECIES: histidine phosphatase family protein [Gordonia]|uniref:Histidine phosphatase family protein n=1 Tax=Gordonia amicalis TaxID=89053 RepID=A0AAE4R5R6_9ACTN|nr:MULTISPECIES: histidine phosphatase family protein [Gordonia]ATD70324.1 phosphoglycerate mutase [Gordonia sp. 1D]MBA5846379.1 histidine phosphatase family protein [Gordonia amicalis]MCZ4651986.1 histidine phosphatase family protein [Gordonia amicalis]MDJ0452772.1 histidine phosphatase family protein [Gordonia amicalis]MDV6310067.1 histidine phosphatase family protein [Gordonia amicalis]
MQIITAGRTGPNRSVRFGGDAPLDERGRRDIETLAASVAGPVTLCGPEAATRETARLLGGRPDVDDALRTLDVGSWAGSMPEEIAPSDLAAFFTDPTARPHGGESVAEFVRRVHAWRDHHDTATASIVVAMPVAQALLCDDPARYFGVEVRPAASYLWSRP